ncbi:MAG: DUF4124 domain-containing protein [Casimicrobiaceae bacterium]
MKNIRTHHLVRHLGLAAVGIGLGLSALSAAAAGMYKWTDDKGIVHYSDQMPQDAVNKGATVFDKQGRPLKKIDAAPTQEELRAKEAVEERLKTTGRLVQERARKDQALLQSYTSEQEIDFARNRAILTVDSQLKSAESYSADLRRRQAEIEKQKATLAGKPVPAAMENELVSLSNELGRQDGLIAQKRDEVASINARYDNDKKRWQEINAEQLRAAAAGIPPATPPAPGKAAPKAAVPATASK